MVTTCLEVSRLESLIGTLQFPLSFVEERLGLTKIIFPEADKSKTESSSANVISVVEAVE